MINKEFKVKHPSFNNFILGKWEDKKMIIKCFESPFIYWWRVYCADTYHNDYFTYQKLEQDLKANQIL